MQIAPPCSSRFAHLASIALLGMAVTAAAAQSTQSLATPSLATPPPLGPQSQSRFSSSADATPAPGSAVTAATVTAALTVPDAPAIVDPSVIVPAAPAASAIPADFFDDKNDPKNADPQDAYKEGQQTKRILFIVPNFRSVSVDAKLKPLTVKQKFGLAVSDSFDYSSFIYVGMLAGVDMAENETPQFHQGAAGYARYYWHDFADNTIGNFMTEAVFPSITREDPRYYTLGRGGFFKRTYYAVSRLLITRTDADPDRNTFNISEIAGNGVAAGLANLYYPSPERTWTKTGQKWLLEIGLDGASNILKEFWPDVAHTLFHAAKTPPEGSTPPPATTPAPQQ